MLENFIGLICWTLSWLIVSIRFEYSLVVQHSDSAVLCALHDHLALLDRHMRSRRAVSLR